MVNEIVPSRRCRCCGFCVDPTVLSLALTQCPYPSNSELVVGEGLTWLAGRRLELHESWLLSSQSSQSSPKSSTGCGVRIVPFPQRRSSAEQYLSHPQQIRSGCFGFRTAPRLDTPVAAWVGKGILHQSTV